MNRICPHCRFPFDPDWGDDPLPALCPRCGMRLAAPSAGNPRAGIAAFLHKPVEADGDEGLLRTPLPTRGTAAAVDAGEDFAAQPPASPAAPELPVRADAPVQDTALQASAVEPLAAGPLATAPTASRVEAGIAASASAPTFARTPLAAKPSRRSQLLQWSLIAILLLVLGLQLLLADRDRLGADPDWRPVLLSLCKVLGCELAPWHEPKALTMLNRDVRALPGNPGALQVQAEFRNDARWAQPLPVLLLTLSDADGRRVGQRAFTADEYLSAGSTALLQPGQSLKLSFNIREPATPASAFQFEFR